MIAKCLQNLANLVEFGGKEPYMEVVNPFILKNKERMVVFLDHLSSVRDKPYPDEDRVKVRSEAEAVTASQADRVVAGRPSPGPGHGPPHLRVSPDRAGRHQPGDVSDQDAGDCD